MLERLQDRGFPKRLWQQQHGQCPGCGQLIDEEDRWDDSTRYPIQGWWHSLAHQLEIAAFLLPTSFPCRDRKPFRKRSPGAGSLKEGLIHA